MAPFKIVDVSAWPVASEETLGSKVKLWLRRPRIDADREDELWLWKALTRVTAGDDWAEKVAEQLAGLLGLPHPRVELASRDGLRGIISQDFRRGRSSFVPGNELLWLVDPNYPKGKTRKVAEHTVERVLDRVRTLTLWPPIDLVERTAVWAFVGYLMFDAWIGNQDRHHENWGAVVWEPRADPIGPLRDLLPPLLAPSFDHAASLGQYETDGKRTLRLSGMDPVARLETWALKATSHLYRPTDPPQRLTTFEAFDEAASHDRDAGRAWLDRLQAVEWRRVSDAVEAVPEPLISPIARQFTLRLLDFDRTELLTRHRP